jgi:hypothetical protein
VESQLKSLRFLGRSRHFLLLYEGVLNPWFGGF